MKPKNDWLEKLAEQVEVKTKPEEGFYSIKEMAQRLGKSECVVRRFIIANGSDFEVRSYKPRGLRMPAAYYRKRK